MKIDLDYIKKILTVMEEHEDISINVKDILEVLEISYKDDEKLKPCIKHLQDLYDIGSIDCENHYELCKYDGAGNITVNISCRYRITVEGHELLEAMNNDTLWNKVKAGINTVSIETVKQIPALALKVLGDRGQV